MSEDQVQQKIEDEKEIVKSLEKFEEKQKEVKERIEQKSIEEEPVYEQVDKMIKEGQKKSEIKESLAISSSSPIKAEEDNIKEVENILAEGLDEVFMQLPPSKQSEFKLLGEQTAKQINTLLTQTKVKINKIIELIKKWLALIPGINKFFLEQEAKIKADEIMKIKGKFK